MKSQPHWEAEVGTLFSQTDLKPVFTEENWAKKEKEYLII